MTTKTFATGNVQLVPIGAILPWAKTIAGVPALLPEYLECNGQVINDAASPLNGVTLPNLNGNNNYLRGAAASGGTGGGATHDHDVPIHIATGPDLIYHGTPYGTGVNTNFTTRETPASVGVYNNLPPAKTSTSSGEPPYYEVVWIMRIK